MDTIGNTYNSKGFSVNHAKKVWRAIHHVYPGGGIVSNIADWTAKGIIPSGRPCKFDSKTKTVKVYTAEQVTAGTIADLGINGYIQEDVRVENGNTVGSVTVVYGGEIYEYMVADAELAILKTNTLTPQIVWVN